MPRLESLALIASLFCGMVYCSYCEADLPVDCLEYPIYDDGVNYLFVCDEYLTDMHCETFNGEYYFWVTGDLPPSPQPCSGHCTSRDVVGPVIHTDAPLPAVLPKTFVLGTKKGGGDLDPAAGIRNRTGGILPISPSLGTNDIVWFQAKGKAIPVKLFKAYLDYAAAGVDPLIYTKLPGGRIRGIFVGIEVDPTGLGDPVDVKTPKLKDRTIKHTGTFEFPHTGGDIHTYHIVTNTDLQ